MLIALNIYTTILCKIRPLNYFVLANSSWTTWTCLRPWPSDSSQQNTSCYTHLNSQISRITKSTTYQQLYVTTKQTETTAIAHIHLYTTLMALLSLSTLATASANLRFLLEYLIQPRTFNQATTSWRHNSFSCPRQCKQYGSIMASHPHHQCLELTIHLLAFLPETPHNGLRNNYWNSSH